ncbi:hypothetical protein S7711_08902 [Stachybotrys chartarum IBT 7711]|uniref:Uncharacterized protein n=1 Tax=Stachybotrys chartarum (strain CBS 109288 / IBT 7711) TaxID=1280523 RepID=A0A084B1U3_STACB|nr:hypothetical protein S7711_08902 [Stachybotrys chartarum IBT 7711]KFA45689.1 hypothetical protein S40293_08018 [Stachybotrys chartarum IBT 40293]
MTSFHKDMEAEKATPNPHTASLDDHSGSSQTVRGLGLAWQKVVSFLGVEVQGNDPIPADEQTDRRYIRLYTLWFSMNFNLISIVTGMSGPLGYGLSLRDSSLVILFFGLICALSAPYLSSWGPMLGLRQMIHARYAFGLYGAAVPLVLNMATLAGYCIMDCILGGQVLSAINPTALSINVGIVITAIISMVIIFCGAAWIHMFDLYAWFPTLVGILVAVGCGGHNLYKQAETEPASASSVLSFAAVIAGFFLPWSAIASDFTVHFDRRSPWTAIFVPSYLGLTTGAIPLMILGAAIAGAMPNVPSWADAYTTGDVGGVISAMLEPVGGFGSFLLVLLALSVLGNLIGSLYALTLNWQALLYLARIRIPRVVYTVAATAVIIPVAITIAAEFFGSLNNFMKVIGYWPAAFLAVVLLEHLVVRKGRPENYDLTQWEAAGGLPYGIAALAAAVCSFSLVIPGMSQNWFVGPFARTTGDIGFELAFALTSILYLPFRFAEIKLRGHV